jgi:uncharacterized membrane protein YhaH (DUF805 family)
MQADVERLLARLFTDHRFRERFLADPAAVAREAGLSPVGAEEVARMPAQDLHTAARSYQHKRDANGPPRIRKFPAVRFLGSRSVLDWPRFITRERPMNFTQAITSGFQNYVNFSGRAVRSEFWYWVLFAIIVSVVAKLIDLALFSSSDLSPISALVGLALFLPGLAITVRRLHDGDRSGWWILLNLIPLIGAIVLIVWYCTRGTIGPNRFGPDPLGGK